MAEIAESRQVGKPWLTIKPWGEPAWMFGALSWVALVTGYTVSRLFCTHIKGSNATGLQPSRRTFYVATHRSMVDSFIIAAKLFDFPTALRYAKLAPWNLPEVKNFTFFPLLGFAFRHLHCLFINRGSGREVLQAHERIVEFLQSGANVLVFPNGGRESLSRVLHVDPRMGKLVHRCLREVEGVTVVAVRLDGMPVWAGPKMHGNFLQKFWQYYCTFRDQTSRPGITVSFSTLDLSAFRNREPGKELNREIAQRIEAAVRPLYPPNPAENSQLPAT